MKTKKDRVLTEIPKYKEHDRTLPPAIIVDIDGTIALINDRSPFDVTKRDQDLPHTPIVDLINYAAYGYGETYNDPPTLIFLTGRGADDKGKESILTWIEDNTELLCYEFELHTRGLDDYRGDVEVKRELFEEHVEGKYNILWVFEDRDKMVNFWRNEMHLPTLQVKDGAY